MNLTFLGTGCAYPSPTRAASGIILQHINNGIQWLFDCGEGTQIQIQKIKDVKFKKISKIFITHLHGDHVFGLPGFLSTMTHSVGEDIIVDIYGPLGLKKMLRTILGLSHHILNFKYCVHEIIMETRYKPDNWSPLLSQLSSDPPLQYEIESAPLEPIFDEQGEAAWKLFYDLNSGATVWAVPLRHSVPCFGYIILKDDKQGHLNVTKAQELGVPKGPLLGRLKNGENVITPEGSTVYYSDVLSESTPGINVAILGDTKNSESLLSFINRKDIKCGIHHPRINYLIHEATLENEFEESCICKGHSTPRMVADIAHRLNVNNLILTHYSQRYVDEDSGCDDRDNVKILRDEIIQANTFSGEVFLAKDLMTFQLK